MSALSITPVISHLSSKEMVNILSYLHPKEQLTMRKVSRIWIDLSQERLGQFALVQSIAGTQFHGIKELYDTNPEKFEGLLDRIVNTNFNLVSDSASRAMGRFFYNVLQVKGHVNAEEMTQWLRKLPPQKGAAIQDLYLPLTITDRQLAAVIELCPNLKKLQISNANITGEGLANIPENNQLEYVILSSFNFDRDFAATFFSRTTKLKELSLSSPIAGEILCHIPKDNQLEKVRLGGNNFEENHLIEFFSKAIKLKELNLGQTNITGECLNFIVSDQLEEITLSYCSHLDENYLAKFFSNAATLKRIDLTQSPTTGEGLTHLPIDNQLQSLTLINCRHLDERCLAKVLPNVTLLKELNVSKTIITGECLAYISEQNQLKSLILYDCKRLNEVFLEEALLKATMLTKLDISETAITGQALVDISEHTQLEELIFYSCKNLKEALLWQFFSKANKIKKLHSDCLSGSFWRKVQLFEMLVLRNGNCKLHQQPEEVINFLQDLPPSKREEVQSLDFTNGPTNGSISYSTITEEEIAKLLQLCPNLKFLAVGGKLTGEGLSHIPEDNQLEKLFFYTWTPDERFLAQFFSKAKKLKEVKIEKTIGEGLAHLPDNNQLEKVSFFLCRQLDEAALATLFAKASFLKEVDFSHTTTTAEGLSHLPENNQLEKASFFLCRQLDEEALATLFAKALLLKEVTFDSSETTLEGLANIPENNQLEKVGFKSFKHLNEKALKKLFAKTSFLKEVTFDFSETTFKGLLHLPEGTQLEKLSLRHCHIDEDIFNAIISKATHLNNIDDEGATIEQKNMVLKTFKKIFRR